MRRFGKAKTVAPADASIGRREFLRLSAAGLTAFSAGAAGGAGNPPPFSSKKGVRYTLLTTFPGKKSSSNVGDQLIEIATKRLVTKETGVADFLTIFREDALDMRLDEINATAGILLPAFPIRDNPMYPGCYRLTEDLGKIKVPLIPIGANWNVYPGDSVSRENLCYSRETVSFLRHVAAGVKQVSCREYLVCEILKKHGVANTVMTGDPAWYDPEFLGKPLHRPAKIGRVVFSPPLSAFYGKQGEAVMMLLSDLFPSAQRICAMHLTDAKHSPFDDKRPTNDASMRQDVAEKNAFLRRRAHELGFEIVELAGKVEKLDMYRMCDLHVGYECHAHVGFLRQRRPSVLIAEDARGVGFNYTFGVGGFNGFSRRQQIALAPPSEGGTSGYCVTEKEFGVAGFNDGLMPGLRRFLEEECASRFRRYLGVAPFIDETYEKSMKPFLRNLPA
ncbi:MAG: polysaccharide pyruvyl transferase family protein [Kiritimatiellae bacterium]|nr:polysaccharide pyruvyl transferase family protein [Kiritimatiellia bacterium]